MEHFCKTCLKYRIYTKHQLEIELNYIHCKSKKLGHFFTAYRKKLQFITLLTAIVHCFTHRKQQK